MKQLMFLMYITATALPAVGYHHYTATGKWSNYHPT